MPLVLIVIIAWTFVGCKNPSSKTTVPPAAEAKLSDSISNGGKKLVIHYSENQFPQSIYPLDSTLLKNGYTFDYKEDGELLMISQWEKGVQRGDTYVFEEGTIKAHQLFDSGKMIYQGNYEGQAKVDNHLYPQFVEEFFFEDKYYAKIRFLLPYSGHLQVQIKNNPSVISSLENQTFQLVINDALDLSEYKLHFTYQPSDQDTLLATEYLYRHVVYFE